MTANYYLKALGRGVEIDLFHVVKHINVDGPDFHYFPFRQFDCPLTSIIVPANSDNGCDTLQCFEHGAIEEGALTVFNIALEQFHNAVADRKALLISMPQNLQRAGAQFRATGTL